MSQAGAPSSLPRWRTLLLVCALFGWFNAGVEAYRLGQWGDIAEHPARLLWPPWQPLRAYVSRESDERLYFEYSRLLLGEQPDLGYLARKQQGDAAENLARLAPRVSSAPGMRLPYRDFPLEYPPLPLALMLAPRVLVDTLAAYRIAFGATIASLFLLLAWVSAALARALATGTPDLTWRRLGWLALAVGPILCSRFDLLPALLVAAAVLALARRSDPLAGALFGLAVMAKLYPALLLLPVLALLWANGERRRAVVVAGVAALAAVVVALPFLLAAPEAFLRSVMLYGARPFQIESLAGGVLLALGGSDVVVGSFGSYNARTPELVARLADLFFWTSMLGLAAGAARSGLLLRGADSVARLRALVLWVVAALAVILCTSKVLSPQFLIWLLPLPALLPARTRLFGWMLAAAALTQAFYPFLYDPLLEAQPLVVVLLLARNAALLALAARAVRAAWRGPEAAWA